MLLYLFSLPNSEAKIAKGGLDLTVYSRFKHGCIESTRILATDLAKKLLNETDLLEGITYFSSTLKTGAPSASHWLANDVVKEINNVAFEKKKTSVRYMDLLQAPREPVFKDYSRLDSKDRHKAQGLQLPLVTVPDLPNNSNLVIINDVYVTGAQYEKQKQILKQAGINAKRIYWQYIAKFQNKGRRSLNTRLENYMNNYAFPNDRAFLSFLKDRNSLNAIYPNKRLILKILTMEEKSRRKVILLLNKGLRRSFLDYALLENMHLNSNTSEGLELLAN